jgi:hypothetical protein
MDNGERAPATEPAAPSGTKAAIEAAFASMPDIDFSDDVLPAATPPAEKPASDEIPDSASTEAVADASPKSEDSARSVEEPAASPVANATLEAPKHWPADRRASFQALPDDAKKIVLERNKEANVAVTKAQQEAAQYRRTSEAVASVFNDDHRAQMRSSGLDEIGAIQYLVQQHDALNRDPVGFLKAVIAQTGVKAEQLFGGQPPQQQPAATTAAPAEGEWKSPTEIALEQKLAQIEAWRDAQEAKRQADERKAVENQHAEANRHQNWFNDQCVAFETAMDDEGNPKYPHLPAVMGDMVRLVHSDPAAKALLRSEPHKALEQAYNQALYLNPDIRQQIIDADLEKRLADREAANSVKKAQAATTRKGSPGANGTAKPKLNGMTTEQHVDKAARELGLW